MSFKMWNSGFKNVPPASRLENSIVTSEFFYLQQHRRKIDLNQYSNRLFFNLWKCVMTLLLLRTQSKWLSSAGLFLWKLCLAVLIGDEVDGKLMGLCFLVGFQTNRKFLRLLSELVSVCGSCITKRLIPDKRSHLSLPVWEGKRNKCTKSREWFRRQNDRNYTFIFTLTFILMF